MAFSQYDQDISYCQGLNYIAGILLMHLTEESCFWAMVEIMNRHQLRGNFVGELTTLNKSLQIFSSLVHVLLPPLADHLEEQCVSVDVFAFSWFHTLFTRNIPTHLTLRIWDIFIKEGITIIFRVAIAILKESKEELLKMKSMELNEYLKNAPLEIFDSDPLIFSALKVPKKKILELLKE